MSGFGVEGGGGGASVSYCECLLRRYLRFKHDAHVLLFRGMVECGVVSGEGCGPVEMEMDLGAVSWPQDMYVDSSPLRRSTFASCSWLRASLVVCTCMYSM